MLHIFIPFGLLYPLYAGAEKKQMIISFFF